MAIGYHTNSILWNLYGIKLPYYGICMISNSHVNEFVELTPILLFYPKKSV